MLNVSTIEGRHEMSLADARIVDCTISDFMRSKRIKKMCIRNIICLCLKEGNVAGDKTGRNEVSDNRTLACHPTGCKSIFSMLTAFR